MSIKTNIEWCDSTVNPTRGCDGCELFNANNDDCYAKKITDRFGGSNAGLADDFAVVSVAPGRMKLAAEWPDLRGTARETKPWLDGLPRLIFVGDMADNLSAEISFEYLHEEVIATACSHDGRRHQWLWLTKRPHRMSEFSSWLASLGIAWPSNLWAGTSVTTQSTTSRIGALMDVGDGRRTSRPMPGTQSGILFEAAWQFRDRRRCQAPYGTWQAW